MKKKFLLFLLIVVPLTGQAQISTLAHRYADVFYPGSITFVNGRTKEYAQVEVPKFDQAEITVATDEKRKHTTILKSEEIESVTLWTKDFPDIKTTLYHIHTNWDLKGKTYHECWGYPIAGSPWGIVFKCHHTYTMDKKTGELNGDYYISYTGGMRSENPVPSVLVKKGDKEGYYIINSQSYGVGFWNLWHFKATAELFADNAEIKAGILDLKGGLLANDIQYILEEMWVSQMEHSDALPVIESTLGDDL